MRQPDWQTKDGRVRMYLGDCLEVLSGMERESADCIVTDPPYSSGGLHRAARARSISEKYVQSGAATQYAEFSGDARDQRSWSRWCAEWMRDCLAIAKTNRYMLSFVDWRQVPAMTDAVQWADWTWCGLIPWNKGLGSRAGNTSMFRHQCEYVVWCTKGGTAGYADRSGPWPGFFECGAVNPHEREHQSQKPLDVLRGLLKCCNADELVVDPFMGSGSTGVAAVQLGLQFMGCELDATNFQTSVSRISAAVARGPLFEDRPTYVTRSMFEDQS